MTAHQNPWGESFDATPWTQKTRPGLAASKHDRALRTTAGGQTDSPVPFTTFISGNRITARMNMNNDARIERLLREAHVEEDTSATSTENAFVTLVIVAITLLIYWGTAAFVLGSASNWRAGTAQQEAKAQKLGKTAGVSAPQPNPSSVASNGDSNAK